VTTALETSIIKGLQVVVKSLALKGIHQGISFGVKNHPANMLFPVTEGHPWNGITIVSGQTAKCVADEPGAVSWKRLEQGIDVIDTLRKDYASDSP